MELVSLIIFLFGMNQVEQELILKPLSLEHHILTPFMKINLVVSLKKKHPFLLKV